MEGKVRIYIRKKKGKYQFKQAVILVKSKYIEELEHLDGQEVSFILNTDADLDNKNTLTPLERELLSLLVKLFTRAFQDDAINTIIARYPETEKIVELLKKMKGDGNEL